MATDVNFQNIDLFVNSITTTGNVDAGLYLGDGSQITNLTITPATIYSALVSLSNDSTVNNSAAFTQKNVFPATTGAMTINNGGFTCSTSGIVVPESGTYIVGISAYYTTTTARANVLVAATVNGTATPEHGSSGYIRSASDHNESSACVTTLLELVVGDEVGVAFAQEGASGTVNLNDATNISHAFLYRVF